MSAVGLLVPGATQSILLKHVQGWGMEAERLFYMLCLADDWGGIDKELVLYPLSLILFLFTEETLSPIAHLLASLNHSLEVSVPRAEGQDMAYIPGTNLHTQKQGKEDVLAFFLLGLCQALSLPIPDGKRIF